MEAQKTPEGVSFTITGGRVVFPTPEHKTGGGVSLTDEAVTEILAFPDAGEREDEQLEWEATGEIRQTRVGSSKVVKLTQTSFGRTRTTKKTLVDVADANVKVDA